MEIQKTKGKKKRVGRGIGSRGSKSGRGMKGQRSRAGYSKRAGFEGGQTPLYMRIGKKRGAKQIAKPQGDTVVAIPVSKLEKFKDEKVIGPGVLRKAGLLASKSDKVKIIGNTEVKSKFTVRTHFISVGAKKVIESAGGKVEVIGEKE